MDIFNTLADYYVNPRLQIISYAMYPASLHDARVKHHLHDDCNFVVRELKSHKYIRSINNHLASNGSNQSDK